MCPSSRFKQATVFSLLLTLIAGLALLGSTRLPTYAAKSSLKSSTKPTLSCGAWNIIPNPSISSGNAVLHGVTAINTSSAWTVGYSLDSQGHDQTLIEHWDGTSWNVVSSPNPGAGGNILYGAVAISASNVWAVGTYWDASGNQALIERWNGKSWTAISNTNAGPGANLIAITRVPGTNQLWAVGFYQNNGNLQTLIEHWDGISWSVASTPIPGTLRGITANSTSDVWAVGIGGDGTPSFQTLIEHWDGTSWSVISNPNVGPSGLFGVARVPGTSKIWTVGFYEATPSNNHQTLTEMWDGTKWNVVANPSISGSLTDGLSSVVVMGAKNIWAVGSYTDASNDGQTLTEHWNGKSWNVVSSPNAGSSSSALLAVTRIPGTSQLWAIGISWDSNNLYQPLIEFYC